VCETELCFVQTSGCEKIYCENIGFYFVVTRTKYFFNRVNQCVRKQVSGFVLSNGTNNIVTPLSCIITSVKEYAATSTVLLLYTQDRS
jgi:hypothetical protein